MKTETLNVLRNIQQELKVPKSEVNKFGGFNYRTLEQIETAIKPILQKHEAVIYFTDRVELVGSEVYIVATVHFCYGDDIVTAEAAAREIKDLGKKKMDESQATGSASSYARKYAVSGLFCIDDGNDADRMAGQQQQDNQRNNNRNSGQNNNRQQNNQSNKQQGNQQNSFFSDEQTKSMRNAYKTHREIYERVCANYQIKTPKDITNAKKAALFYDDLMKETIAADNGGS